MKPSTKLAELLDLLPTLGNDLDLASNSELPPDQPPPADEFGWLQQAIELRIQAICRCVAATASDSASSVRSAVELFSRWMLEGTIVRVLGAGRARLAAAIPANRLSHGGARVFVQNDIVPMPHSIKGGGVIAASASGRTEAVLQVLKAVHSKPNIKVVGIAPKDAAGFRKYCDIFIGIQDAQANPLSALADTGEYVISELLDALVVAAGRHAGFDDTMWKIGHEDLGATGPYDFERTPGSIAPLSVRGSRT